MEAFETRPYNRLRVSSEARSVLQEIYPYWRGKTVCERLRAARTPDQQRAVDHGLIANPHEYTGLAHVALDVPRVLREGIEGVPDSVDERHAGLAKTSPVYLQQRVFLEALLVLCAATINFAQRYADLARSMARSSQDVGRRDELLQIAAVCDRVPAKPARSFWEALQALWFLQVIPQIECNGFSITPGRFDRYM